MPRRKKLSRKQLSLEGKELFLDAINGGIDATSIAASSVSEFESVDSHTEELNDNLRNDLIDIMDDLVVKQDATKITALKRLMNILTKSVCTEEVGSMKLTMSTNLLNCINPKTSKIQSTSLALQVLTLLSINLGSDEVAYFNDIKTRLKNTVRNSKDEELKIEALRCLTMSCFVCCDEPDEQNALFEFLGDQLDIVVRSKKVPEDYGVTVIECSSFFLTLFKPSMVISKLYNENSTIGSYAHNLNQLINEGVNISIRAAACEAIALLVEYKYAIAQEGWSYEQESGDTSPIGGIDERIKFFMHETGKNIGKKNRKDQRTVFKAVLGVLEKGDAPKEDVVVGTKVVRVSTWAKGIQLDAFRKSLQNGIGIHMLNNLLLHDIFEISGKKKTGLEVRTVLSKRGDTKKKRTLALRSSRDRRNRMQNDFIYE